MEPRVGLAAVDLPDDEAMGRRVADRIRMIDVFLDEQVAAGKIAPLRVLPGGYLLNIEARHWAEVIRSGSISYNITIGKRGAEQLDRQS